MENSGEIITGLLAILSIVLTAFAVKKGQSNPRAVDEALDAMGEAEKSKAEALSEKAAHAHSIVEEAIESDTPEKDIAVLFNKRGEK